VLDDIISKSEEHFGLTAGVGYALTSILQRIQAYCPAEPATSSMDIALRAAGIYRRMEKKIEGFGLYRSFNGSSCVLVTCYSEFISEDFYNGTKKGK
jgi:hypothetical protein